MSASACHAPLEMPVLAQYWLGELNPGRESELEAHLFECAACTSTLERLVALGDGVRELVRKGEMLAVVSDAFLKRLAAEGVRLNEYRVPRNGSVNCTIAPEDEVAVVRLEAPLGGVERIDVVVDVGEAVPNDRMRAVPFDAAAGEIAFTSPIARLRALPVSSSTLRLVAVDAGGEQVLGEYRFNHTPWAELQGSRPGR